MIRAANLIAETRRVDGMAGTASVTPDWTPVAKRIREEATDSWDDKVAVDRLVGKGVVFARESGRLTGPRTVAAGDTEYEARKGIVIATGTVPSIPPIDGLQETPYWTNREAIETETLPASLVLLGGGAIGLELAQVFARFGVTVTVVEAIERVLAMEEPESSDLAQQALERDGITFEVGARAEHVSHDGKEFTVTLGSGATVTGVPWVLASRSRVFSSINHPR